MSVDASLPSISVVTPSYNQARFLPDALSSIHDQRYPGLEHVVVDGGSNDGSVEILRSWQDRLAHWGSEPDAGQYDAINKGFARTSGELMCWLNSDDMYVPGALRLVGEIFAAFPRVEWLTTLFQLTWDEQGAARTCSPLRGMSSQAALQGQYLTGGRWHAVGVVQQESTFWRRSLWERTGGYVDAGMRYAGDFDLWLRFARETELYGVAAPLGGFRRHDDQKTAKGVAAYLTEARGSLQRHGRAPTGRTSGLRRRLLDRLAGGGTAPRAASPLTDVVLGRAASYSAPVISWSGGAWGMSTERLV